MQARAKFPSHRGGDALSWPAAKWARDQYQMKGGQYVESERDIPPQFRDYVKEEKDRKRDKERRIEAARKKRGLL